MVRTVDVRLRKRNDRLCSWGVCVPADQLRYQFCNGNSVSVYAVDPPETTWRGIGRSVRSTVFNNRRRHRFRGGSALSDGICHERKPYTLEDISWGQFQFKLYSPPK